MHTEGIHVLQKQLSIFAGTTVITILLALAGSTEIEYSREIQTRLRLFRNLQSFVDCSAERSIRYIFFIHLESIHHKLAFFQEFFFRDGKTYCYTNFICNADFLLFSDQILGGWQTA